MQKEIYDEIQLLGYGETDTGGPWIKLRLSEPERLEEFRGKKGQVFSMLLKEAEIGD